MDTGGDEARDYSDPDGARPRLPSKRLDQEGVLFEKLRRLKNEKSRYLSTVTARRNEIDALLSREDTVQLVKEKLPGFLAAVEQFKEADHAYSSNLQDDIIVTRCQEQLKLEPSRANFFYQRIQEWIKRSEELLRLNSQINPEDSTSQIGSRTTSRSSSRKSRRSSQSGSNRSGTSSLAFARAKEAACIAELEAEAAVLEKRRSLEEQKLRLQHEQERLTLEPELSKSKAKDQVLSSIIEAAPRSFVPNPIWNLESRKVEAPINALESKPVGVNGQLSVAVGRSTLNPEAAEWHQLPLATNRKDCATDSEDSGASSSLSERAFHEMLGLHHNRKALQQQQNKIALAAQQKKSILPQQRVPIFDGDPMEYGAFVRAFQKIIESKTSSSSEMLYYLEQFTSCDVKELVRSCHYLPPERGYQEARRLMKKKFGDDYRIVAAYETKALNWPDVRAEDSTSLDRFSIFLMRCQNAMECSKYLTKLEQPDTIQKLVMKLPFNLRKTWRRSVDHIMETERRPVTFSDLTEDNVDNEARVASNPVFGKITEDAKPRNERKDKQNRSGRSKTSLAAQVDNVQSPSPEAPLSGSTPPTEHVLCSFCNSGHAIEACEALRRLPYPDRIQFLKSKHLCFGCLSSNHAVKERPERKTCTVANCTRKHPTILHTNTAGRIRPSDISIASTSPHEGSTRVRNGMVKMDRSRIGMAVVQVKVWLKSSGPPVVTYAFLDSGSSSMFCTESLMRQLGVDGTRTPISLTTLEKKDSPIDSFVVILSSLIWMKMSLSNCQHFIRDLKYPFQRRTYPLRVTLTSGHTCAE